MATFGQNFAGQSAVTFIWSAIPYRNGMALWIGLP